MTATAVQNLAISVDLAPDLLVQEVLPAFDALAPREQFLLQARGDTRALLRRLQTERKGQFDWTPAPSEPGTFRVEISRRAAPLGELRAVNEALSWDHDRLDELDASAFAARSRGDFREAAAHFGLFAFGLRRHIRFEEELLFPEFEARLGLPANMGPTAVMRDEHREILSCLARLETSIGEPGPGAESLRHALHDVLLNHNLKEENIVYPGTDRALTAQESDALVARIQAL